MARSQRERRKHAKQMRAQRDKDRAADERYIQHHTITGDLPFPSKSSAKQERNICKYWRNMTYSGTCWVRKDEAKRSSKSLR